ncbi:MAG: hypothetical protein HYR66_19295 [Sphingobacteriales bacterium]|nr:hypothetical protein [Sphingobacteriales bacterium]MBI3718888.1 hypothetical protein [Sphingobacteriales bacterium]
MNNFTPEDLLLYLYNEVTPQEKSAIEAQLQRDWTLREKLNVLKASLRHLNEISYSPRTEVVLNILHYNDAVSALQEK